MNETVKFTWFNILTYVAIIVLGYIIFMGVRYRYSDDPKLAFIVMSVAVALIFITFVGAQWLKASGYKPPKLIRWERFMLLCCALVYLAAMVPFFWFWNVYENREKVETNFQEITKAAAMFDEYNKYTIARYDAFSDNGDTNSISRENKLAIIDFMLNPPEIAQVKDNATKWLNEAVEKEPTVWNVFVLGNASQIEEAIRNWHGMLVEVSQKALAGDDYGPFDPDGNVLDAALQPINNLRSCYAGEWFQFNWLGFGVAILLLVMLIIPYIVQRRNTKSTEHLWPRFSKPAKNVGGLAIPTTGNDTDTYDSGDIII